VSSTYAAVSASAVPDTAAVMAVVARNVRIIDLSVLSGL
jgi:hypothetical protein